MFSSQISIFPCFPYIGTSRVKPERSFFAGRVASSAVEDPTDLKGSSWHVKITCFGVNGIDNEVEGWYDCVEALPQWLQEKLALLMMTTHVPPTHEVDNVGRRIEEDIFWVYHP